jgi:hypothetical protein
MILFQNFPLNPIETLSQLAPSFKLCMLQKGNQITLLSQKARQSFHIPQLQEVRVSSVRSPSSFQLPFGLYSSAFALFLSSPCFLCKYWIFFSSWVSLLCSSRNILRWSGIAGFIERYRD